MGVNEHVRLSYFITKHNVKRQNFYCSSTFHSHIMVFNNEHNSYPKIYVVFCYTSFFFHALFSRAH